MEKISKLIKILGYVDYALSLAVLAYGVYVQSWLYGVAGVVGLVIAYLKPAERLKVVLQKKLIRKTPEPTTSADLPKELFSVQVPVLSHYVPRRRYARVGYYVGYDIDKPNPRMQALNPRDYVALLLIPNDRFQPGIKATEIVPR